MSENTDHTISSYLGHDFQQSLIWQLLVEPEFAEKSLQHLAIEYFDDPNLKRLFIIILEYYKEYGRAPNLQNKSIYHAINEFKSPNNIIEGDALFEVIKRIELWNERIINKKLLSNGDVIQQATKFFIKQQEYRKIGEFILNKTKTGEIKNKQTINYIEELFLKTAFIGDEDDDSELVTENIDRALRKEFRQTTATGIEVIDALTGGGLGKGEIGIILTPSGVGKTTILTKIANTGYEIGKNVAQIIFEDTKDQIKRKHYTIWSGISLTNIDGNLENVKEKVYKKVDELTHCEGRLVIKKFSQENTTMADVKNWLISYQKKHNMKFELLVLDYLDCLEPNKKTTDRNEAELSIVKSFETLASDLDIPAWTAIQSNRSGFDAEFVEAHQSGGSIKRIQKAHFFMSVAKTPEQKEAHLANIRIIKARFATDGQTFKDCIFNNDTMEIRIEDDRYKNSKLYKGQKHHDSSDIERLESMTKLHVQISDKYDEASILERVGDVANEGANEGVSEGTSEGISDHLKSLFSGSLETYNEMKIFDKPVEEKPISPSIVEEVIFDDNIIDHVVEINNLIQPNRSTFEPKPIEINSENHEVKSIDVEKPIKNEVEMITETNVDDIETMLIDPDMLDENEVKVKELLAQSRRDQHVIK